MHSASVCRIVVLPFTVFRRKKNPLFLLFGNPPWNDDHPHKIVAWQVRGNTTNFSSQRRPISPVPVGRSLDSLPSHGRFKLNKDGTSKGNLGLNSCIRTWMKNSISVTSFVIAGTYWTGSGILQFIMFQWNCAIHLPSCKLRRWICCFL